ncbi:MAG: peptidoglycan-binding protein [Acidobacteriales bacterium]|nr:peptidoglycan-binding protein [Terriglobales bacterium]
MQGKAVERIQQLLRDAGIDPGDVDGIFGPHTQAASVAFQLSKGLVPDGEVGPVTMKALRAVRAEKPPPTLRFRRQM